jgi:hypothetical protein
LESVSAAVDCLGGGDRRRSDGLRMAAMSLVGFIVFLILGVVELYLIQTLIYPALRLRFEEAKVTGASATNPKWVMNVFRVQCLIAFPLIGLMFGKIMGY